MAEIINAEHMGFCYGVKLAVSMAETVLAKPQDKRVYAIGSLIHNKNVNDMLKSKGLTVVKSLDDVEAASIAIVRSHGEGKAFYDRAEADQIDLVDATCPNVARIHRLVFEASQDGKSIIIIGDKNHPEVEGTAGWCEDSNGINGKNNEIFVIGSIQEAEEFVACHKDWQPISIASSDDICTQRYFVVSQTTASEQKFFDIVAVLKANLSQIEVVNTVCNATHLRQVSSMELAKKVDVILIVGDKESSNTQKLAEIAKKYCKKAYFVENSCDLPLKELQKYNKIGITAGASTPTWIIKEVIAKMSEILNDTQNPMYELMDEIDKQLRRPRNGEIITGDVIQVTDKDVVLNIGGKKDGVIPRSEVTLEPGQTLQDLFKEGDEVQAKIIKNDDGDGNILLSKKKVIVSEHWEDINKALEEDTTIDVNVIREVNGGVIAAFNEINGFIPMSQLSDRYVEKANEFVGQTLTVKVMRVDQKRNKVVFSHKAVLAEERRKRMAEIWDQISVGDVITGKVMRFTDYGAFVDIGGIDGLLHISEISWGKLRHPSEVLELDQEISVKVLSMNKEKEKISLGYKQNLPEPWSVINEKYQIGQVITGKAVQLKDYGVFVELEPGLDGLVHISEVAFKRVNNISEEVKVGQDVQAKILDIDKDKKRISLSIKETLDRDAYEAELRAEEAKAGDPSKEAFDADKDQELEIPDPDGVDAGEKSEPGLPSQEAFDADKDQEFELPDADGVDVVTPNKSGDPSKEGRDSELEMPDPDGIDAGNPSKEAVDADKDQELEIPDPDAVDAK
ncbi:MAG: bifunctional 4-hydroxy-3-methylbut-2-enyl diphosphate reductase/30S ribosomal protein S1 [Clostridiales Family XIII bacterium]|jgi:4-hydroxy-3-methylbut-2-enyl diphosphate reductase|nr:bifunctional 4-hydroxy-3-methylbut-2-enyl diphosphate reductase/30S ribosomal protein S1 [Clostridiales Family XIII bacterium]